jgi:DNA-binding NarL/FixJ family response regulator
MLTRHAGVQTTGLQGAVNERRDRSDAAVPWQDTSSMTLHAIRSLTPRQREVLKVMMEGKSNKGICRILNLAEPTVKNHVTAILRTLQVTNRTAAVIKVASASALAMSYTSTPCSYLGYVPAASPLTFR